MHTFLELPVDVLHFGVTKYLTFGETVALAGACRSLHHSLLRDREDVARAEQNMPSWRYKCRWLMLSGQWDRVGDLVVEALATRKTRLKGPRLVTRKFVTRGIENNPSDDDTDDVSDASDVSDVSDTNDYWADNTSDSEEEWRDDWSDDSRYGYPDWARRRGFRAMSRKGLSAWEESHVRRRILSVVLSITFASEEDKTAQGHVVQTTMAGWEYGELSYDEYGSDGELDHNDDDDNDDYADSNGPRGWTIMHDPFVEDDFFTWLDKSLQVLCPLAVEVFLDVEQARTTFEGDYDEYVRQWEHVPQVVYSALPHPPTLRVVWNWMTKLELEGSLNHDLHASIREALPDLFLQTQ